MTSKILLCPHCSSTNTIFKEKVKLWECQDCDQRFEDPSACKIDPQTIFLSYAHKSEKPEDYDISEELVLLVKVALEKDGHTVWIDKEGIRGGHNWRENITRAILGHDHFLSFLSKRSVRDPGVCLNEIAIALDKGVNFQTVLTEPEEIVKPPITVTDTQWHQFVGWQEARSQDQATWGAWFSERMNGIRAQIEDVKNARAPGELTILRRALEPKTFHADIAKKTEGFFGRKWLFEAFDQWLDNTKEQIFWLKGSPGIGKSAFAAKLVHQSNSRIIGFFKCDFQSLKNPEESAKEVICTLAYQLATRMPDYRAKLLYGQRVNDPEVVLKKTADDLFRFLITEPLNKQGKIVEGQRSAIVIDALDEAGRNDGTNPLLTLIKKHAPNLPDWLGIVITSRPEGYIVQELADIEAQNISGDTAQNTQDLKDYLDKQLDPRVTGDERAKIIDQIIVKSDGTFLYISQIIKDKYDLTKPELLPEGMNGYFMENFSRYFKDVKEYSKETEPFLELLVAAPGPLPKAMGQELLGWTDRDVTLQVIEPMGSLLQEKEGGLIFFHKSLADWLQDPKRSGRYQVNPGGAKKLGEFLWMEFEKGQPKERSVESRKVDGDKEKVAKETIKTKDKSKRIPGPWEKKIIEWLPILLPSIKQWQERDALKIFSELLHLHIRYQDELITRQQHLHLSEEQFEEGKEIAISLNDLGNALIALSHFEDAKFIYQRALKIYDKNFDPEDRGVGDILNNLAISLNNLDDFKEAKNFFSRAIDIYEKNLGPEHPAVAITLNNLGFLLTDIGEYNEAEALCRRALEINEKVFGLEYLETLKCMLNLGSVLHKLGRDNEAELLLRRNLEINERVLGSNCLGITGSLHALASLLNDLGRLSEAEILQRRDLEISKKFLGPEHDDSVASLNTLGNILRKLGKHEDAEVCFNRSVEISEKIKGLEHSTTAMYCGNLGLLLAEQKRLKEAKPLLQNAINVYENIFGLDHPHTMLFCINLSMVLLELKEFQNSENILLRCLKAEKALNNKKDNWFINKRLVRLYQLWGKPEEAEKFQKENL